ncbi:MAG: putative (di)nucleoside polyphosphate hydrolase [Candidatus Peribacteria bacterium]|nr:putative (di)nucleoside polyphosphate hydrolase [Candidatus Peribacteria bacterium]
MTDKYRQAASMIVLRPNQSAGSAESAEPYELLLLHKPRRNDAWQLPQGGLEQGENVEQAALRELEEEAGLTGCTVIGQSAKVYCYNFPSSFRRFRPDDICGQQIGYIFALAPDHARIRVDEKEIDGHVWITPSRLPEFVERREYLQLMKELVEEALALLPAGPGHGSPQAAV